MTQRAASAADAIRLAVGLARALTIGMRTWGFYPPEHPAVAMAVERFIAAATDASAVGMMQLAVTPHALLLDGLPIDSTDLGSVECAELLHDRDILQLTLIAPPTEAVVRALLTVLTLDRETRRARGGPAAIWSAEDQAAILLEQIDYQEILEREIDDGPARRDATWKAIVRSIIMGQSTFSAAEQDRLLEISRDVGAIGELCKDAKEPFCMPDGSPMLTTQAATVLAVYRHIAKTVTALEPERVKDVIDSLAMSAGSLEPSTAIEMLLQEEQADEGIPIAAALKQSFDDQQVALLLARAMSSAGMATGRLAAVLDTLAPDEQRKKRILALAKKLLNERDFGSKRPIDDIRKSLDELLLQYDESTYVSKDYRGSMDEASSRAADLAARGLPPEMDEWLDTLGSDSVRRLSGQLLIDLLRNETIPGRMTDTARDMAGFVEELLLAGAFNECVPVIEELTAAITRKPAIAPDACRKAIDSVGGSGALKETVSTLGEQTAEEFAVFEKLIRAVGISTLPTLLSTYHHEDGVTTDRLTTLIIGLGSPVIPGIRSALDDQPWFVQRELARALGKIGTSAAIQPLQGLLRRSDLRVLQVAVASLSGIHDAAAERALHTVLKATTGEARAAVINALVALKDPRIVPMLARVLQDSNPFGPDHPLMLEVLTALAMMRDDRAVPPIAALARKKRWVSWRKTSQTRRACLRALDKIGTAKARESIADFAKTGDFFLRRLARAAR
ncbi:MAG TPA: HEAT repeat domain-containing protein [Vicinamibacterales bacterium]|nr:HEAT repeat domain-containing protein [Vicinamibacterales bacterium]